MYTLSRLGGGLINDITYKFRPVLTLLFQVQIYILYCATPSSQHTRDVHPMLVKWWASVEDGGPPVISTRISTISPYINKSTSDFSQERRGHGAMSRAPDSLTSHACVPVSNPAVPVWGVSEKQHCFSLLNLTRRSHYWRPSRVKIATSVSTLISNVSAC